MKKFNCEVTKTYIYEIEMDDSVWTEEEIQTWGDYFQPVNDLQDIVEILAEMKTKYDAGEFIEGFGIPLINGKIPFIFGDPEGKQVNKDININTLFEDCDVDCTQEKE